MSPRVILVNSASFDLTTLRQRYDIVIDLTDVYAETFARSAFGFLSPSVGVCDILSPHDHRVYETVDDLVTQAVGNEEWKYDKDVFGEFHEVFVAAYTDHLACVYERMCDMILHTQSIVLYAPLPAPWYSPIMLVYQTVCDMVRV